MIREHEQYRDAGGVVHRASDTGHATRITFCERYDLGKDTYDTAELELVHLPITCFRCLHLSQVFTSVARQL